MSTSDGQSKFALPKMKRDAALITELVESYAKLNEAWAKAEADLLKFSVPVPVVLNIDHEQNESYYLGFVRCTGKWRICWGHTALADEEGRCHWTPISQCSLDIRISSVQHFAALRARVCEAAEQTVADMNAAIAKLQSQFDAI